MTIALACRLLRIAAMIASVIIARRRSDHRSVATFLVFIVFADLVRWLLTDSVDVPVPYTGSARVAFHVRTALFLAWPAGLAMLVRHVYLGRRPLPIAIAWAVLVAVLVVGYPTLRGELLRKCYLGAELAALMISLAAVVEWAWKEESLGLPRFVALVIVGIDIGTLLGPYRLGLFTSWEVAQVLYALLYAALILIQGGVLWASPKPSSSA